MTRLEGTLKVQTKHRYSIQQGSQHEKKDIKTDNTQQNRQHTARQTTQKRQAEHSKTDNTQKKRQTTEPSPSPPRKKDNTSHNR